MLIDPIKPVVMLAGRFIQFNVIAISAFPIFFPTDVYFMFLIVKKLILNGTTSLNPSIMMSIMC